jgi:hypothetical protein
MSLHDIILSAIREDKDDPNYVGYGAPPKPNAGTFKGYHLYNATTNRVIVSHGMYRQMIDAQSKLHTLAPSRRSKLSVVFNDGQGNWHPISPQGVMQEKTVHVLNRFDGTDPSDD